MSGGPLRVKAGSHPVPGGVCSGLSCPTPGWWLQPGGARGGMGAPVALLRAESPQGGGRSFISVWKDRQPSAPSRPPAPSRRVETGREIQAGHPPTSEQSLGRGDPGWACAQTTRPRLGAPPTTPGGHVSPAHSGAASRTRLGRTPKAVSILKRPSQTQRDGSDEPIGLDVTPGLAELAPP